MRYVDGWKEELLEVPEPSNELILFAPFDDAVGACMEFYIKIFGHGRYNAVLRDCLPVTIVTFLNRVRLLADNYFQYDSICSCLTTNIKNAVHQYYRKKGIVSISMHEYLKGTRTSVSDFLSLDYDNTAEKLNLEAPFAAWREEYDELMLYLRLFEPDYYKMLQKHKRGTSLFRQMLDSGMPRRRAKHEILRVREEAGKLLGRDCVETKNIRAN